MDKPITDNILDTNANSFIGVSKEKFFNLFNLILNDNRVIPLTEMFNSIWDRFSTCPASGQYHGSYKGGLKDHTYLVTNLAISLYKIMSKIKTDSSVCNFDSLVICSIIHDVGKLGGLSGENLYLNEGRFFKTNKSIPNMEHELRTLAWLSKFKIELNEEEIAAIYHHSAAYSTAHQYVQPDDKHPLLLILHSADNLVAKLLNT